MILASVFAIVLCFTIASHMGARVFKYGEPSLYSAYLKACKKAIPTTSLNAYKVEKEMRERLNKLTWLESGINPNMHIPNLVDVHNFEPWLQRISLGRYHAHLSPCKEYQDKTDRMRLDGSNVEEIALKMQREYNEAMDVLEDVLDIWRSALQSRGVGWLVFREGGAEMEVREVAETFAVDIMLDSYFSGVPAADIAA